MKRTEFFKKISLGLAAIVAAPFIVKAIQEEEVFTSDVMSVTIKRDNDFDSVHMKREDGILVNPPRYVTNFSMRNARPGDVIEYADHYYRHKNGGVFEIMYSEYGSEQRFLEVNQEILDGSFREIGNVAIDRKS